MLQTPTPAAPSAPHQNLTLATFLVNMLRGYPAVEDAVAKLCEDPATRRAFHYYMVKEHFAGLQVQQRGLTYYVTRLSPVRGTAGYEQYTYHLWHKDETASVDQNPKTAYRLFSHQWFDWVTVPH